MLRASQATRHPPTQVNSDSDSVLPDMTGGKEGSDQGDVNTPFRWKMQWTQ